MQILFFVFVLSASIQCLQILFKCFAFWNYKSNSNITDEEPPVSIIVCTHNRFESIKALVDKLLLQEHPDFEIIVVDDRSSDETEAYFKKLNQEKVNYLRIDRTPEHINHKKYALTIGIKSAKNEIILLTDDDCLPGTNNWISSISSAFEENINFVLGYSSYKPYKGVLNAFIRFETLWTALHYLGLSLLGIPYMGVGRNLAYRKSLFVEKKGFSSFQNIVGGDDDLFVNAHASSKNTKVVINENSLIVSEPKISFRSFFRQKLRHLSVGKKYKNKHNVLLGALSLAQILFWFSFIILMICGNMPYVMLSVYFIRMFLMILTFRLLTIKVEETFNWLWIIPFDLLYSFYYLVVGCFALFRKTVKWI